MTNTGSRMVDRSDISVQSIPHRGHRDLNYADTEGPGVPNGYVVQRCPPHPHWFTLKPQSPMSSDISPTSAETATLRSDPDDSSMMTSPSDVSLPWFSHIDFWPKCTNKQKQACDGLFESFEVLVQRADIWLHQNPNQELINCETMDKKVLLTKDIYNSSMVFIDEEAPTLATHIKGLRLWYRKSSNISHNVALGQLHHIDFIPKLLNPGQKNQMFENLEQLIERFNKQLAVSSMYGHIINMETVGVKLSQEEWVYSKNLISKPTNWYDEYNTSKLYFIRVFFRNSLHSQERVGVKDFVPDILNEGGVFHPAKFSSFTALLQMTTKWINQCAEVTVLNIQTLDTKHWKRSENKGKRFNTGVMFEKQIERRFRAFYIRVFYKECSNNNTYLSPNPRLGIYRQPRLTCRTYIPIKRSHGYENMKQMLERAEVELRGLYANIYHIETVAVAEWLLNPGVSERGERTFFDGEWYFIPDQDGNEIGPYRYALLYAIKIMRQFDDGMAGAQVSSFVPEQVMRTAYNPFIVDLMPSASSLKDGAVIKFSAGESGYMLSCWGVSIKDIYPVLYMVPNDFRRLFSDAQKAFDTLQHFSLKVEMTRIECCENSELSLSSDVPVELGPVPRERYPLILLVVSDFLSTSPSDDAEHIVFHGMIIHLKDNVLSSVNSHVISHLVRAANGKPVDLKHLYTSEMCEGTTSQQNSAAQMNNTSTNHLSADQPPDTTRGSQTDSTALCIVCLVNTVNKVILPCRHACVCDLCFDKVLKCPMCRGSIQSCFSLSERQEIEQVEEDQQNLHWFDRLNNWLNKKLGFS